MWEGHKDTVKMCLRSMRSTFHYSVICHTGYDTTSNLHDGKLRHYKYRAKKPQHHDMAYRGFFLTQISQQAKMFKQYTDI